MFVTFSSVFKNVNPRTQASDIARTAMTLGCFKEEVERGLHFHLVVKPKINAILMRVVLQGY